MNTNIPSEDGEPGTFRPYFIPIQKMVLYETRNRFFLVGSNQTESKFRILKIDRTEPKELVLVEDQARYSSKEMKELLSTIACINRPKNPSGLVRTVSAFGIFGFVQFLEGYYIILVTKRRKVATIGYHSVYKIEDTACIYIPCDGPSKNPDEMRYLKLFQSIDLSSNFYFTYSYDLTNSLQHNAVPPASVVSGCKVLNPDLVAGYAISNKINKKYVWNARLLEPMEGVLHPDWLLHVTHGFVGQSSVCVYGKLVYLTLIARRSANYAGTRFLKRGANFQGDVANEVETEQIVFDSSVSNFSKGRFTSFVQMRGSIPAHWSQEIAKMVPKPPIGIDLADPYAETAGKHFGELLERFGSPIVIMNLVKKKERKRHESILTDEYTTAVVTLNQFLPPQHRIIYVGFDMARTNKMKEENVMAKLAGISEQVFSKTGFFMTHKPLHSCSIDNRKPECESVFRNYQYGRLQTGIVRINCVDCLDRTNTAQFALGKCALAHQLKALGVLSADCELEFESDVIRMLEELYEDHGDTLALQYGGSQLVHRINTYRKTAPWTSQGNDIMQTLSRYRSNFFSDADKQNAINLFLGVYQPSKEQIPLWELENDIHFHLKMELRFSNRSVDKLKPLTEWFPDNVLVALPFAAHDTEKMSLLLPCDNFEDIDSYADLYRPTHFIPLSDMFAYKISHSVRDFMPNFTTDFSPFVARIRPGKRQEESNITKKTKVLSLKNPSIMGLSSAGSCNSTSSESDYSSSEEMSSSMASSNIGNMSSGGQTQGGNLAFSSIFGTMKDSYGVELKSPRKADILLYKRFVNFQTETEGPPASSSSQLKAKQAVVIPLSAFSKDSAFRVTPPVVSRISRDIYKNYVRRGTDGASKPSPRDMSMYNRYISKSGNPFQNSVSNKLNFKV